MRPGACYGQGFEPMTFLMASTYAARWVTGGTWSAPGSVIVSTVGSELVFS